MKIKNTKTDILLNIAAVACLAAGVCAFAPGCGQTAK